jgi:hypothetical protein
MFLFCSHLMLLLCSRIIFLLIPKSFTYFSHMMHPLHSRIKFLLAVLSHHNVSIICSNNVPIMFPYNAPIIFSHKLSIIFPNNVPSLFPYDLVFCTIMMLLFYYLMVPWDIPMVDIFKSIFCNKVLDRCKLLSFPSNWPWSLLSLLPPGTSIILPLTFHNFIPNLRRIQFP